MMFGYDSLSKMPVLGAEQTSRPKGAIIHGIQAMIDVFSR